MRNSMKYIFTFLFSLLLSCLYSQVSINNESPNPSSILDLEDPGTENQGLMPPKGDLTLIAQGVDGNGEGSANAGLLMYDESDNSYYFFNGSSWERLNPFRRVTNSTSREIVGEVFTRDPTTIDNDLTVTGDLNIGSFSQNALVPTGGIIMWSGTTPPDGWALCNGSNGTPNLRGRFIVGYDPNDAEYDEPGNASNLKGSPTVDTGGEEEVTLDNSNIPAHQHEAVGGGASIRINSSGNHGHTWDDGNSLTDNNTIFPMIDRPGFNVNERNNGSRTTFDGGPITIDPNSGNHTHPNSSFSGRVGNGSTIVGGIQNNPTAIENRPPYYTLAYIMKLP